MTHWLILPLLCSTTIARADADDPLYVCKGSPPNAQLSVSFRPETDLKDLITWTMGFQCRNVVVSADVLRCAPKVTVIAPRKMTPKQALELFVDAVDSIGLVAIVKPDTIVIKPGPTSSTSCAGGGGSGGKPPAISVGPADPDVEDEHAKVIATIKKINDTQFEVPRALIDKITANPMAYMKGARVVPAMKDGKPEGTKLYAIRPSSLFAHLGFTNGDTLISVNGHPLTSAEHGLEIYQKLRTAKRFDVSVVRRGKPVTIVITIK